MDIDVDKHFENSKRLLRSTLMGAALGLTFGALFTMAAPVALTFMLAATVTGGLGAAGALLGVTKHMLSPRPEPAPETVTVPELVRMIPFPEHNDMKPIEKPTHSIGTLVYENTPDYPQSDTHHRDKVLAQARQALLNMDHTKAVPH